jgi:hypothetical protein
MWADIQNYEGRYQVSSLGRVKSLARMRRGKNGAEVPVPELIMALSTKKDTGRTRPYIEVRLRSGGLRTEPCKSFLVHRLVAAAFIKQLDKGDQVDHINGDRLNNNLENLRLVNHQQNHFNRTTAKGYYFDKKTKKWRAKITLDGKNIHLGRFNNQEEAREAYLQAKNIYHNI